VPVRLSLVVFTLYAVVASGRHAALLEICGRSRMGKDHSCPVSRRALSRYEPRGNPCFTLVSDANPLRRLLLGSKKNSFSTEVSPFRWIGPSHQKGIRKPFYQRGAPATGTVRSPELIRNSGSGSIRLGGRPYAHARSLVPLVKARDFGMTPRGAIVGDFQIDPLPKVGFVPGCNLYVCYTLV